MPDATKTAVTMIPLLDLSAQYAPLRDKILAAVTRVCDSQRYIMGPEITAFESEIAALIGVRYAVSVTSGTDALLLSLRALDVGRGDEVITTPFTFFATAGTIHNVGATPAFVAISLMLAPSYPWVAKTCSAASRIRSRAGRLGFSGFFILRITTN